MLSTTSKSASNPARFALRPSGSVSEPVWFGVGFGTDPDFYRTDESLQDNTTKPPKRRSTGIQNFLNEVSCMKVFRITGFTKHGVWTTIEIKTIRECVELRAAERGLVEITDISEA